MYRIYPTSAQETSLLQTLEVCREVYNSMLHWRKFDYECFGKSPSKYDQLNAIPAWKQDHPELKEVHSQVLQDVVKRVDLAFQAFFRRVKNGEEPGYPRFKGKGTYDSITFPQSGYSVDGNYITLSKIGDIKAKLHRPIEGTIKTLTIRNRSGKWFSCFSCEVEAKPLPETNKQIGIDVGLSNFATLSDGTHIANPRFFRQDEKALAKAQHKLSKLPKGSKARKQARKAVNKIHERIRNRRHNFVHQTARGLINKYDLIAVEELNVTNMTKSPAPKKDETTGAYLPNGASQKAGLNKSILDAAWTQFRNILTQKAESAARTVIAVDPAYTSQDCSRCGFRVRKKLSDRVHVCSNCGLNMDRDENAAVNMLSKAVGLHSLP